MKKLLIALIISTLLSSPGTINAATHYLFNDLQAQFGERILVKSINDSGQIAGVRLDGFSYDTATIWNNSTETPLVAPNGGISWGLGINTAGQVAGASISGAYHATYWDGSTAIDLGTLGGLKSEAYGINNSGQIVGYSNTSRGMGA
ncbi:MAG: hypothetical protein H0X02_07815, partial [Nitrosomonas sp.]|nr:hypothetical protein [Nitrosomonas sp.]